LIALNRVNIKYLEEVPDSADDSSVVDIAWQMESRIRTCHCGLIAYRVVPVVSDRNLLRSVVAIVQGVSLIVHSPVFEVQYKKNTLEEIVYDLQLVFTNSLTTLPQVAKR